SYQLPRSAPSCKGVASRGPSSAAERPGARHRQARQSRADEAKRQERAFMSSTFETVAGIISDTADIPREQISPESHAIDDLGIDSLAFLDLAFSIDKAFGIQRQSR